MAQRTRARLHRPELKRSFSSLKHRNYKLYVIGQLVSNTGNWLTNVALTLLVLKITGSGVMVGVLAAFQYGPVLLLSAWAGSIADRVDKRTLIIVTQSLEMAESAGLAALAFLPSPPIAGLYALALFGGVCFSLDRPLRRAFVSEMVPREDIPNAVVLYGTILNGSRVVGPALAGLLIVTLGYGWCFTIDAASYLAVIACLALMRPRELYREAPQKPTRGAIRAGLRYVLQTPALWISFAMLAAIGTLAYNFQVTLPLLVTRTLHSSDVAYTIIYAVFSLGAVISGLIIAQRREVHVRHAVIGAAALGAAMLLLAAAPDLAAAIAIAFFVGVSAIMFMTATMTIVQLEAEPHMLGRIIALQSVIVIGTKPIGGPLLGWLADAVGARVPILIGGLVCLAAAGFGWQAARRTSAHKTSTHGEPALFSSPIDG